MSTNILIVEFVADNILLLGLILAVLKIIAMETKSVIDDKIVGLFTSWVEHVRSGSIEQPIEDKVDLVDQLYVRPATPGETYRRRERDRAKVGFNDAFGEQVKAKKEAIAAGRVVYGPNPSADHEPNASKQVHDSLKTTFTG